VTGLPCEAIVAGVSDNTGTGLQFGVFDHIEHLPDVPLAQLYEQRLEQLEVLDQAGFHCYFVAEHHTPAIHAMAPSQNVFLAAASQRTKHMHLGPGVYVLPLYHPLRLIEEISMLDNLTKGRLEVGVGRGGVLEAFFWGQGYNEDENRARFEETLAIVQAGLSHDVLSYSGRFLSFDEVPMRLRPLQQPYPPFWYMRNSTTSALRGMNALFTGTLDQVEANITHFRRVWAETWGEGAVNAQGLAPKVGASVWLVLADTDHDAARIGEPAYEAFSWNLGTPRRLEAERRQLGHLFSASSGHARLAELAEGHVPELEMRLIEERMSDLTEAEREARARRRQHNNVRPIYASPDTMRAYMDEYLTTGANYLCVGFQFGSLTHEQAMRSIELFVAEVMPYYKGIEASIA
jgi:alkanesulfonate monooxygenase SsuD/methylene tetrahydromethanopterin reductase-like flavin-dependent oxidoreductase (luciferase family)